MSIKRQKVWAAFRKPKGVFKNSNRPKGVAITAFGASANSTDIWLYARTKSILEKKSVHRSASRRSVAWGSRVSSEESVQATKELVDDIGTIIAN